MDTYSVAPPTDGYDYVNTDPSSPYYMWDYKVGGSNGSGYTEHIYGDGHTDWAAPNTDMYPAGSWTPPAGATPNTLSTGGIPGAPIQNAPAATPPPAPAPAPVASAPAPSNPTVGNIGGIGQGQLNLLEQQITAAVSQQASTSDPNEVVQMGQSINAQVVNFQQEAVTGYQSGSISANQMQNYLTFSTGVGVQSIQQEITTLQNQGGISNSEYNSLEQQYSALNGSVNTSVNDMMERDPGGSGRLDSSSLKNELSSLQSQINGLTVSPSSTASGTSTPPPVTVGSQPGSSGTSSGSTSSSNNPNSGDSSGGGGTGADPSQPSTSNSGVVAAAGSSSSSDGSSSGGGSTVTDPSQPSSTTSSAVPVAASSPPSGGGSGATYTVVSGDTMWGIAQSNNIPLSQLEALNPQISNPELILPGQTINLGGGGVDTSTSNTDTPASSGSSYTVVHGDTLSGIAAANGMALSQLEAFNPQIKDPDLIFPGQNINLSSGTGSIAGAVGSQSSGSAGSSNADGGISTGSSASGSSGAIGFPEKSSYSGMGSEVEKAGDMTLGEKAQAAGWVDGSSGTSDIAKDLFEVDNHTSTDPLKIDDRK